MDKLNNLNDIAWVLIAVTALLVAVMVYATHLLSKTKVLHKFWQVYFIVPMLLTLSKYLDPDSFNAWVANFILMGAKAFMGCLLLYGVQRLYLSKRSKELEDKHYRQTVRVVILLGYGLIIAGSLIN